MGPALAEFPLAGFALPDTSLLPTVIEQLRDVLSFRVPLVAVTQRTWKVRIALTPALSGGDGLPIAELAGQRLVLHGAAVFTLTAAIGLEEIDLAANIEVEAGSGFALAGPLIAQLEDGRRALALISDNIAAIPKLDLAFRARSAHRLTLCHCRIPAWWDTLPAADPIGLAADLLSAFEVDLDGAGLQGLRFGSMEGTSPHVRLTIDHATPEVTATAVRLHLALTLAIEALDPLHARWTFELELGSLAFRPAGEIQFTIPGDRFDAYGLHVAGLGAASIGFVDGQIVISADDLRAYYDGVSSPGDRSPGFELAVPRLQLGPAGVDTDMHLVAGAPKLISTATVARS